MANTPSLDGDLYMGLTGLKLSDSPIELGSGIVLRHTFARFLLPLTLVNTAETVASSGEPRPSFWQFGGSTDDITAELLIPKAILPTFSERLQLAKVIVFLARLWTTPAVVVQVLSSHPFNVLTQLTDDDRPALIPAEIFPRYFHLDVVDESQILSSLNWLKNNWSIAHHLYITSSEFKLAADALDSGQFVSNSTLMLLSLWGALEAIFSPSTSELKFRVSALIASYLESSGSGRARRQKEIARLYDKRSAAAHGRPKHADDDLLKTFELLRRVLIKMIREKKVPTKDELEKRLFED